MSDTEFLQHPKLNCTVWWTMIASGLPNFIRIVCLKILKLSFKTSFDNMFNMFKIVLRSMSDTELLQHPKLNYTV